MSKQEPKDYIPSNHKCFWLPLTTTMKEVFPRHDTILCLNAHRELAYIILPEMLISIARAKVVYEQAYVDIAFIQHIYKGKDESYLVPIRCTQEQVSKISHLHSCFTKGKLKQELKKGSWTNLVTQIRESSLSCLHEPSFWQPVKRVEAIGNEEPTKPDDLETLKGYDNKVPVFIYTNIDNELQFDKEQFHRELLIRRILSEEGSKLIEDAVRKMPGAQNWHKDEALIQTLNRVEAELMLNLEIARPPMVKLALDSERTELILEPEIMLKLTPEGEKAIQNIEEPLLKSWFSITNWEEPNIAQIILHVGEPDNVASPENTTSPAITIIRDELGIHTLPTYLFRISTDIFDEGTNSEEIRLLDEVPASEIPEIRWKPATGDVPQMWWQTDAIVKKILWLVTYNLCSHQVGEPLEVVCSVTPIGDNVIQVAIAEGSREEGTPYAFAVIQGELEINALPVFPSGTLEHHPNGSAKIKQEIRIKNYTITRGGDRKQAEETFMLLDRPIYSWIVSGRERDLLVYETRLE